MSKEKLSRVVQARSAGFVLIHLADLAQQRWQYLLLKHALGGHWSFPKGTVEAGESAWQTAIRELEEETGIANITHIPGFEVTLRYHFQRDCRQVDKTVIFFLAHTAQTTVTLSPEHAQSAWLPYDQARLRLTHSNSRQLLDRAENFLTTRFQNTA